MTRHQPRQLPRIWMMSDERMGDAFLPALARLPKGSGLVFRHYGLARAERRVLFDKARIIARARRIMLVLAGSVLEARAWRADGAHQKTKPCSCESRNPYSSRGNLVEIGSCFRRSATLIKTAPIHSLRELIAAKRAGADLVFASPVFFTRSHIGGRTLGRRGFAALAIKAKVPVIALGGMTARRARSLNTAYGWAGIDAWL